ncbi:aldo/keto reductase [Paramaledivibacter caminithermalis]|uniref:Predicted oxidoreductase of the aldo/keto reductase family n=1 Tax=Paramaledivibacter caminithermalis (strain DSM 15212 / CIP 107654 / DViRD3) TaxID=1121301 RepID=A0A1M6TDC1_PARC5|nr:aldo/keto reductase [Paramaledivibacter caminithermalis]SHK54864.1 Predicted oxidoreductase of the aldo/keto reductase family [Paramaledivibacter caminithermalis DSM 15212]
MQKRRLGRTNIETAAVGFGGIPIQKATKEKAIELIRIAKESGINFIDTARAYGKSEELIGYGINATSREHWYVATKSMARSYEEMKADIEISLRKLQLDYIDLYQMHNIKTKEIYKRVMSDSGALKALKEAKEEGKIKNIGITSHSLDILVDAIETNEFASIQFPYNPIERQGEDLFERANELDIGVIVMKPVAGGAIRNVEYSLRYILENKNVTVVIPGMDEAEHIRNNAAVANPFIPMSNMERDIIEKEAASLGTEFCRRCGYCQPCSVGIDIPTQFVLEGYLLRYDLPQWAKDRYMSLDKKAEDCIRCGMCEPRCPYNLPIVEMLKRVSQNFAK